MFWKEIVFQKLLSKLVFVLLIKCSEFLLEIGLVRIEDIVSKLIVIFDQFVEVTLDSVDIFSTVLIKRFLYVIPAVEYLVHDCLSIV